MKTFRKLNQTGCDRFWEYLINGADGDVPLHLLKSTDTSEITPYKIDIVKSKASNKYEFGLFLRDLLKNVPDVEIENDYQFWDTMSLLFFDNICYRNKQGDRKVQSPLKWMLRNGHSNYYRHLLRSPWLFVKLFGETSKFLLMSSYTTPNPLCIIPDALEQFGSRGILLRNKKIVNLFSKLYFDHDKQEPKPGLSGYDAGSPRRMGKVMLQLALTYDLERMTEDQLKAILPREFDRWID